MGSTIFSDAWFRVSDLRVALLPNVEVRTQSFRGQTWHVLQDTYTQRYFRASVQACNFIMSLQTDKTVEAVWEQFVNQHPKDAPSQEEVIQLLSQLHMSNLLYSLQQSDNEAIVKRYKDHKRKELMGKFASFLFIRIPLWNPDKWLDCIRPLALISTGWGAFVVWLSVMLMGVLTAFEHRDALVQQTQGILSISNLPWLYVCMTVLKLFHETGHALVIKRYGGEVRAAGVMFLLLTPLPYVDATSSWGFANRWHRIYVSFAGMAVDFFFAAAGALVWANTAPGLTNSLAFNVMLIGSVSSLLFNGNPLLRFDAYFMLSDYAEIPNLYQKAQQQWKYFGNRYILGTLSAQTRASDERELPWLTVYGFLSFIYLMLVTLGITLFLLDQWLPLGLLVLGMTLYRMLINPVYQLGKHVSGSATQGNRRRAISSTVGIGLALVVLFGVVPFPDAIRTPGILEANHSTHLYLQTPGTLQNLYVRHGDRVQKGQRIASLDNTDLLSELAITESATTETELQHRQALHKFHGELEALTQKRQALALRTKDLQAQLAQLDIFADQDGEWVAPELHELKDVWLARGYALGQIIDRRSFRFVAVIAQEQADFLFKQSFSATELRLSGQADTALLLPAVLIIPYQRQRLPSVALGWLGGGEVAVNTNEPGGDKATESFFLLRTDIPDQLLPSATVLHGLSGTLRLELPAKPLYAQALRALHQLLQKRYAI